MDRFYLEDGVGKCDDLIFGSLIVQVFYFSSQDLFLDTELVVKLISWKSKS
jgi:hypothetical protein